MVGLGSAALPRQHPIPGGEMSTAIRTLPRLASDSGLSRYLSEIRTFPMLEPNEEFMLAKRWQEHQDPEAAHRLITSHLRLVAKIAIGYRGYGLPINELISEGSVGMMQAVKRFDPDRGFRLATYAIWWIRAAIQEYVLRSWSMVKIGTTAAQKKLFFNLRRLKGKIQAIDDGTLSPDHVKVIATELAVSEAEVITMNDRLAGPDHSLNAPLRVDGDDQWQDSLVDDADNQESQLAAREEQVQRRKLLSEAMCCLDAPERHIIVERHLRADAATLADLSRHYKISRERVRQIEVRAFNKLQSRIRTTAHQRGALAIEA